MTETIILKFPLVLALLVCSWCSAILAQSAEITGIVRDPQKLSIQGAQVKVVDQQQGTTRTVLTNSTGSYAAPFLLPGYYRIYIQAPNFSTSVSPMVLITVGQTLVFNVVLQPGEAADEVTVEAGSDMMNTTDGAVSTVIGQNFIANLPLNGRSLQDLIVMTPGVVTQSLESGGSKGSSGDFSVNGQRTESNYYTVDGVAGNTGTGAGSGPDHAAGGVIASSSALGTTQTLVPVDALQEFRVESSTYSAEYGRSPGGQFIFATKSGTNTLHGDVYDYIRNDFFDANDWFNNDTVPATRKPALRQNIFGGSISGPVVISKLYSGIGKTFFFFVYEGLRLTQPQPVSTNNYVPDVTLRNSASSVMRSFLNAFPLPTPGAMDVNGLQQELVSFSEPGRLDTTGFRIDQMAGPMTSVFFKFQNSPGNQQSRAVGRYSSLQTFSVTAQNYTLGTTTQWSSKLNNQFRLLYARGSTAVKSQLDSFGGAVPIDALTATGASGSPNAQVGFYLDYGSLSGLYVTRGSNEKRQWNAVNTLSWQHGKHQFRFGGDYAHISSPYVEQSPNITLFYLSSASVLANSTDDAAIGTVGNSDPVYNESSLFLQDEWRLIPSLSLSLGARWELDPAPHGGDGNDAYTLLGNISSPASLQIAPRGTALWKTSFFNFAPRVGAAWQVRNRPGWETVARGGVGVFFDSDNEYSAGGFSGLGFSTATYPANVSLPIPSQLLPPNLGPSTSENAPVYAFPKNLQLPYTLEWNAALQQSLGKAQSLTLTYVAANGRRLFAEQYLSAPTPNFQAIYFFPNGITSNYQALQAQFQRAVAHGLTAVASYTWGHSIDYGSTSAYQVPQRGGSDFDVRHNFQGGLSWDIPAVRSRRVMKAVLDDWGLDARLMSRSAMPVELFGNPNYSPTGQLSYGGLDLVSGQPLYLRGAACTAYFAQMTGQSGSCPGNKVINPLAVKLPNGSALGSEGRNMFRGFPATQLNLSARRDFPLAEKTRIQFRADMFNILNHPIFGNIDQYYGDAQFGEATATLANSLPSMSALYQQGGARSMQFSLKIMF